MHVYHIPTVDDSCSEIGAIISGVYSESNPTCVTRLNVAAGVPLTIGMHWDDVG